MDLPSDVSISLTDGDVAAVDTAIRNSLDTVVGILAGPIDSSVSMADLLIRDLDYYIPLIGKLALPLVLWDVDSLPQLLAALDARSVDVEPFISCYGDNISRCFGRLDIVTPRWLGDAVANEHILRYRKLQQRYRVSE